MSPPEKTLLPLTDPEPLRIQRAHTRHAQQTRTTNVLLRIAASIALFCFILVQTFHTSTVPEAWNAIRVSAPPLGLPDRVQRQWGQYSPWFPAEEYPPPPESCELVQVHVLQRHGARYPNSDDEYDKSVGRLLKAKEFKDSKLDFLRAYEYELDEEELSAFGAAQSFESGQQSYRRYSSLVTQRNLPFVRAAGKSRVIDSARNWTVGFAAASHQRYNPTVDVIIPEDQNNTLHNDCPNATDGTKEKQTWLHVFAPPIAKRLSQAAKGAKMFEYHGDVEKFYKTGYGNELGPVQGVGYINELLARLTVRPVEDHTQHNDSFPFPLGRSIYADFTHENLMVAVYSAMGLFNISDNPLSTKKMDKDRIWIASRMVPFSARMVVEKLACDGPQYTPRPVDEDEDGDKVSEDFWGDGRQAGEYVRVLVNDALQPLEFCGGDENGLCTLEAFVESQGYARRSGDGDFEKCYN